MQRLFDLTGMRFERLVVLRRAEGFHGEARWHCQCDCGNVCIAASSKLRVNAVKSCGCYRVDWATDRAEARRGTLTGRRFGHLVVLTRTTNKRRARYECQCDCGKTTVLDSNNLLSGHTISCGCQKWANAPKGEHHHNWKGRRLIDANGYVSIIARDYPNANKHGRVKEHILVMSQVLGRPLRPGENVHHKNGQRADNRPENLELWLTRGAQPAGQRIADLLAWARALIAEYGGTPVDPLVAGAA